MDVNQYSIQDLVDLLELSEPYTVQDIKQKCGNYIETYKTSKPNLAKFFLSVQHRLVHHFTGDTESDTETETEKHNTESESESETEPEPDTESDTKPDTEPDTEHESDTENHPNHPNHIAQASSPLPKELSLTHQDYPIYGQYATHSSNPLNLKSNVRQTFNTETLPGTINPFFKKTHKRMVVIDSKFRENYFQTNVNDFYINFPEPIKNVINMTVSNVDIINAHYTVNAVEGTNFMKMTLIPRKNDLSNQDIPITLEPGNMFAEDIAKQINKKIKLYFANKGKNTKVYFPDDTENNPDVYDKLIKCGISEFSGKTFFTVNPDLSFADQDDELQFKEMQLDFTNPVDEDMPPFLSLGWILGFRNRSYTGARTYKSESIFNGMGRPAIYLAIDDFNKNVSDNISVLHQDSFFSNNLLARVPLRDGKFSITFSDLSDQVERTRRYYGPVDIQRLHIQLFDEYGMLFDNNNMDYTLVLEFETLYQM